MLGKIGSNQKMVVPLIVIALAAISIAALRTTKSAENSRAARAADQLGAGTQQQTKALIPSAVQEASQPLRDRIEYVRVSDRDPFAHWSLFGGAGRHPAGVAGQGLDDLASFMAASPFAELAPFAPLLGPGTDSGFQGPANQDESFDSSGSSRPSAPPDPGLTLASIIGGKKPLAIITDSTGRKFFVSEGDAVTGGYSVESIHSRSVVVRNGDVRISLWLNVSSRQED